MRVSDLYTLYPNHLLIHGITKRGAESQFYNKSLSEQIRHSIENSKANKLSTFSCTIETNFFENTWGNLGLIIKEGNIILADENDMGLNAEQVNQRIPPQVDFDWPKILNPRRYNEIILRDVSPCGLFIWNDSEHSNKEIIDAIRDFELPLFMVGENNSIIQMKVTGDNTIYTEKRIITVSELRET